MYALHSASSAVDVHSEVMAAEVQSKAALRAAPSQPRYMSPLLTAQLLSDCEGREQRRVRATSAPLLSAERGRAMEKLTGEESDGTEGDGGGLNGLGEGGVQEHLKEAVARTPTQNATHRQLHRLGQKRGRRPHVPEQSQEEMRGMSSWRWRL